MDNEFKDRYKVKSRGKVINIEEIREQRKFEELLYGASTIPIERVSKEQIKREDDIIARYKLTTCAGTARRAKEESERRKADRRQKRATRRKRKIAGFLAAGIIVAGGGMAIKNLTNRMNEPKFNELVEQGEDLSTLGLSKETMDTLAEHEDYFQDMDSLQDKRIGEVTNELYNLNLQMIKEKVAQATGYSANRLIVLLDSEKADGSLYVSIKLEQDDGTYETIYGGSTDTFSFLDNKNTRLPDEVRDEALLLYNIGSLQEKINNKKISDKNAWKEAKGYYNDVNRFAAKQVIKDEKGNLAVIDYSEQERTVSNDIQHEDNER